MPRSRPDGAGRGVGACAAAAVLALAAAGFALNLYWLRTLTGVFLIATIAQSINIIAGFTGYAAFGQVVFFGLGAYAAAIVATKLGASIVVGAVAGMAVCALFTLACGIPVLRLKGHYFAIATLGLNEATKAVAGNWSGLTGGGAGVSLPLLAGDIGSNTRLFYFNFLALMAVAITVVWLLGRTRFGYACRAIRADEDGAAGSGIDTLFYKTAAWLLSALLAGLAGSLYAHWQSYIDPPTVFDMAISVKGFVIFLLGGPSGVLGPIVAAFALELASTFVWSRLLTVHLGTMGLIIMLSVLFLPRGFAGLLHDRAGMLRRPWLRRVKA
jgi:branched-chain amino acid transport system permease protein